VYWAALSEPAVLLPPQGASVAELAQVSGPARRSRTSGCRAAASVLVSHVPAPSKTLVWSNSTVLSLVRCLQVGARSSRS